MAGPVALLGSGEFLPAMEDLDRRLLLGRPPRVVHLPTAAGQESSRRLRYWRDLASRHFEERLGVEVETLAVVDVHSANDSRHVAALDGAGLVYLSGGNPGYLAATLRDTAVLAKVCELSTAGAALAGCSAGAAALTAMAPDVRSGEGSGRGLNVVPGLAVIPHYDALRRRRPRLARLFSEGAPSDVTVVGIDEHTAIVTEDRVRYEVYGRGTAVLVDAETVYGPGESFAL